MDERIRPTRSGLFAIELLIAVGVFTLCAAICVGLFVRSEVMSRDSADLTRAVNEARSVAECWKASGGDLERTAELSGGAVWSGEAAPEVLYVNYDENWNRVSAGGDAPAAWQLSLAREQAEGYAAAELRIHALDGGTLLLWDIAALEAAS